jgi:SPP1 gp7 family putative phage head morphogenesis protein
MTLVRLLGAREATHVLLLSKQQGKLEKQWVSHMRALIATMTIRILDNAQQTGRLKLDGVDFGPILMEHSYAIMRAGIESTEHVQVRHEQLAAPPAGKVPRSLKKLREWWDHYRKTNKIPPRQRKLADDLRKAYVDKLQEVWRKKAEAFLTGGVANQREVVAAIQRGADVTYSRAKMIVETETTHYFNKARRQIFDASPDVTHYLFVAIRDHATTKWCSTRQGLVYAKDDPILDVETPPVHFNCRSELLPLTPHNANHLRLIQDPTRARRNNTPEPLPEGWTKRR